MKKNKKKKFNFTKFIIFILVIVSIYFLVSKLLLVKTKTIQIINNYYYTDDEIIYNAKIENYPKFIMFNSNKAIKNISKLDLIEKVNIHKKYGFILEVDVKEYKVLYYNSDKDMYMISNGEYINLDKEVVCPTIINYVPSDIEKKLINSLSTIDISIIEKISEIEYSSTSYDSERFIFYMNDGNMVYINIDKMDSLNKYVQIIEQVDDNKGVLYLDSGNYFEIKE